MIVVSFLSCYIDYGQILRLSIFTSSDNDTMTHKFGFLTHQYRDLSRPRFDRLEWGAYMMAEMVPWKRWWEEWMLFLQKEVSSMTPKLRDGAAETPKAEVWQLGMASTSIQAPWKRTCHGMKTALPSTIPKSCQTAFREYSAFAGHVCHCPAALGEVSWPPGLVPSKEV